MRRIVVNTGNSNLKKDNQTGFSANILLKQNYTLILSENTTTNKLPSNENGNN